MKKTSHEEDTGRYAIRETAFTAPAQPAGLYLVSTPIGNLRDITIRALEVLAGCNVIACEDTRTSGVLLARYGIDRPKVSYNEHNAGTRGASLVRQMREGRAVALISDAGTPLVSDPGFRLVEEALAAGIEVIPIPGASAPLAALAASGLPNKDFRFVGFLPGKSGARTAQLRGLQKCNSTLIFFESPNRLAASLSVMAEVLGAERRACVARELTKMHESLYRGELRDLMERFGPETKMRGEIVIVIEGSSDADASTENADDVLSELLGEMPPGKAASEASRRTGQSRQALYARALELKEKKT